MAEFNFTPKGVTRIQFDWHLTTSRALAAIIPTVLTELKVAAPVSKTHPDAGRFRRSIGYRVESTSQTLVIKFVSTDPAAKWILKPTDGGKILFPTKTMAMRFQTADSGGTYTFAKMVTRGPTPGNDFNVKVAASVRAWLGPVFREAITITTTETG